MSDAPLARVSPSGKPIVFPSRRKWPLVASYKWLEGCPHVTPGAKRMYCLLAKSAASTSIARGWTYPRLAAALACDKRSVSTWSKSLAAGGLLERLPAGPGEAGHRYQFLLHPCMPVSQPVSSMPTEPEGPTS